MKAALATAALLLSTAAFAQTSPGPPGPYILDVRGTMSGVPSASAYHPGLPGGALIPKRAFGIGFGAHVYLFKLGPSRVGFGIDGSRERGTVSTPAGAAGTTGASTTTTTTTTDTAAVTPTLGNTAPISVATIITTVAPQVSFNFGTREGWSYLSGGYGVAHISGSSSGTLAAPLSGSAVIVMDEGSARAINYGGGARWFIKEHLAVGFDLRFHRIAAVGTAPSTKTFVMSVGMSVR